VSAAEKMERDKVELGKLLFFDTRLSADRSISCASCHNPQFAFTDGSRVSDGIRGHQGKRNAPTIINSSKLKLLFWDGRAATLEEQALGPMVNPLEMGNTHEVIVTRLRDISGYRDLFASVFAEMNFTINHVAEAIAAFERTVVSENSPFDRFRAGDTSALSERQQRGMTLFFGKARCSVCHSEPLFTDGRFHNLGVGADKPLPDDGRAEITKDVIDRGKFKTPSLRDVASTAPYMHDGGLATLEEVIDLYNRGGNPNPNLNPRLRALGLDESEKADLVAFMRSLSGDGWRCIAAPTSFPGNEVPRYTMAPRQ
jgi:cytochrome c peroxidase